MLKQFSWMVNVYCESMAIIKLRSRLSFFFKEKAAFWGWRLTGASTIRCDCTDWVWCCCEHQAQVDPSTMPWRLVSGLVTMHIATVHPSSFLPEVQEGFTKSWKALFTAITRFTGSSALTSLDGRQPGGTPTFPMLSIVVTQTDQTHNYLSYFTNNPQFPSPNEKTMR